MILYIFIDTEIVHINVRQALRLAGHHAVYFASCSTSVRIGPGSPVTLVSISGIANVND